MLTLTLTLSLGAVPTVEAHPVAVTVYPNRAWVQREVLVELAEGAQEVIVTGLPETIQSDSIQASASGPAAVTDVSYRVRTESTPAADRDELAGAVARAEDALLSVMNRAKVFDGQEAFLEGLRAKAVSQGAEQAGTEALDTVAAGRQMSFIADKMAEILSARLTLRHDQAAAEQSLDAAKAALAAAGGASVTHRELVVRLQVARATASTITVSALEHRASWSPIYDARIDASTGDVKLDYRGQVVQTTGENWPDVEMTLSTAEPSTSLEPPTLGQWVVDEAAPPPPPSAGRAPKSRGRSADTMIAENFAADMPGGVEASGQSYFAFQATVGGGPVNVTYTLPGRVDVPSDGDSQRRLRIGDTMLDGSLVRLAVPARTDEVFLLAEAVNPGPYLLLPGATSLFVDGGFVGRTHMPTTAPGEPVKMPFGPLPTLTSERHVKTETSTTGLFGDTARFQQKITIVLENATDEAVEVRVLDHRPVSRNSKIKVELDDLSDPLSTDPIYQRDEKPKGILRWDIEVPANAVGETARTITWTLDVRWPKGMSVTGV